MINWVNFLHIYQPPYQDSEVIQSVSKESYWQIVNTLKKNKGAKITLSFSGCLLEHLYNIGEEKLIEEFKNLVKNKQIELVGSARYHPILPLLPANEIKRQIFLNDQILQQAFDQYYQPTGFFLPEMAYHSKVAKIIKQLGYKWIILDEIAYKGKLGFVDYSKKYKIKGIGLQVIFRNRDLSKPFVPETIIDLTKKSNPPKYVILATDGEMYGHHHHDRKNLFAQALSNPQVKTLTVSEYLNFLPAKSELITPLASSWESTPQELKRKVPFALWQDFKNKIHYNLWELRKLAIRVINKSKEGGINYDWARHHLDRGLSSCAWWWAAEKKLDIFDFLTWNPDTIEKGIKELISSIRSLENISQQTKLKAERLYHLLIKEIWKKHWKKYHRTQPQAAKMPREIKKGLSLLDQNFLISLFQKKIDPKIIKRGGIDYIATKIFKKKIGEQAFYHIVACYTVHFKNKKIKPIDIYCNANSRESRQGAFEALKYAWQNGFNRGDFLCPQPLFYSSSLRAMFYIGPEGENLYQRLIDKKTYFPKLIKMVELSGKWLAKFHQLPTDKAKNFNPIQSRIATVIPGPAKMLKMIQKKHSEYPHYYQTAKELFEKINNLEKAMMPRQKWLIHGDFHPENVIIPPETKNKLYVIDYTDCCLADFTRDIGNFLQQLQYMTKGTMPKLKVKMLRTIFLNAYLKKRGNKLTASEKNRVNFYQSWTAFRSALFFLTITVFDRKRADDLFIETKKYLSRIKKYNNNH